MRRISPGRILAREMEALEMSVPLLATLAGMPQGMIQEVLLENRKIDSEIAHGLSQAFGTSIRFWLNLQETFDTLRSKETEIFEQSRI